MLGCRSYVVVNDRLVTGPERVVWVERDSDRVREACRNLVSALWTTNPYYIRAAWYWAKRLIEPQVVERQTRDWSDHAGV